jgi:hypothetical protein
MYIQHYEPESRCQEYGMETPDVLCEKEVQILANNEDCYARTVLGFEVIIP